MTPETIAKLRQIAKLTRLRAEAELARIRAAEIRRAAAQEVARAVRACEARSLHDGGDLLAFAMREDMRAKAQVTAMETASRAEVERNKAAISLGRARGREDVLTDMEQAARSAVQRETERRQEME
ncbi:MAG: hypothetical protein AAFV96_01670 [Pseudomonadota bacterium]